MTIFAKGVIGLLGGAVIAFVGTRLGWPLTAVFAASGLFGLVVGLFPVSRP